MSALFLYSYGSLYSVYCIRILSMSVEAYWYNFLLLEKIMIAISHLHRTESSNAFFIRPSFRFEKVTYRHGHNC